MTESGVYNQLYHTSPFLTKNALAGKIISCLHFIDLFHENDESTKNDSNISN